VQHAMLYLTFYAWSVSVVFAVLRWLQSSSITTLRKTFHIY